MDGERPTSLRIWYSFIVVVSMFAVVALIAYIFSGDKTALTAFESLLALDLAIIVLGYIFLYVLGIVKKQDYT